LGAQVLIGETWCKKIKGKRRHILVDTQGLLMHAIVHSADIQDRDGGELLMATLFGLYLFLLKLYADGGYQGEQFNTALKKVVGGPNVEIVKRSDAAIGFVVLPKRWVVNRCTMLPRASAPSGLRSSREWVTEATPAD
jgi:transposase